MKLPYENLNNLDEYIENLAKQHCEKASFVRLKLKCLAFLEKSRQLEASINESIRDMHPGDLDSILEVLAGLEKEDRESDSPPSLDNGKQLVEQKKAIKKKVSKKAGKKAKAKKKTNKKVNKKKSKRVNNKDAVRGV